MNTVLLIGRLTKDPEINHTRSGQTVASFTLAVDKGLSKEKKEEAEAANRPTADFPRIIAWGNLAENAARYLGRGSQCAVLGRIQTGSYEDRETGKMVYTTDVIASNIEFLSKLSQNQGQNERNYNSNTNTSQGYKNQSGGNYGSNNEDDFFDDDFYEVEDYGRIPF